LTGSLFFYPTGIGTPKTQNKRPFLINFDRNSTNLLAQFSKNRKDFTCFVASRSSSRTAINETQTMKHPTGETQQKAQNSNGGRRCVQRMVSWHRYDGGFWIRIGKRGRGFAVSDKIKHPPLFSERYGYRKVYRIGKCGFEILKPSNIYIRRLVYLSNFSY